MTILDEIRSFMLPSSPTPIVVFDEPAFAPAPPGLVPRRITAEEHTRLVALWADMKAPKPQPLWTDPEPPIMPDLWCPFCHRTVEVMTEDEADRVRRASLEMWEP
jgi:hypothetical protein